MVMRGVYNGVDINPANDDVLIQRQLVQHAGVAQAIGVAFVTGRRAIAIQTDPDSADSIYIGSDDVFDPDDPAHQFWTLPPGKPVSIPIGDSEAVTLYARCKTGATAYLEIWEIG